jgi:hypothetical protein
MDRDLRALLVKAADRAEEVGDPLLGMLQIAVGGTWPPRPVHDSHREMNLRRVRQLRSSMADERLVFRGDPVDFHDPLICELVIRTMAPRYMHQMADRLGQDIPPAPETTELSGEGSDG